MRWMLVCGLLSLPFSVHAGDIGEGKKIFSRVCSHCHYTSYEDKFGPGLAMITERRDTGWLNLFLQNPSEMIRKDEYAQSLRENNTYDLTMPTLPEMQDKKNRENIIAFLLTLKD